MSFSIDQGGISFQSSAEERRRYGELPPGRYPFVVLAATAEDDDRGANFNLKLSLDDPGSPYANKWVWARLYYRAGTVKPKAVEIGRERLRELFGIIGAKPSAELTPSQAATLADKMIGIAVDCEIKQAQVGDRIFYNVNKFFAPSTPKARAVVEDEDIPF